MPNLTLRAVILVLAVSFFPVATQAQTVFINEFHYDNFSTDAGEAIEIAGPAGTDLSTYSIELYNGNGGTIYDTDVLFGAISNQQDGFGTRSFPYPVNGIQNGAPDGIALVHSGVVVQFLSYEGSFMAKNGTANGMTSTDIGVSETGVEAVGMSLQLQGTGNVYTDFTWAGPIAQTADAVNTGQTFVDPSTDAVIVAGALGPFGLAQNQPNPFRETTQIRFDLPRAGDARIQIYDVAGRLVRTLVDQTLPAGPHTVVWDGRDAAQNAVAGGIYFYRLTSGGETDIQRMHLVR